MIEVETGNYPNHFDEAMGLPRVDISPLVRDVHVHGFKRPKNDLINPSMGMLGLIGLRTFQPTQAEALDIYRLGEVERYVLTSVMADRVINRALSQRAKRQPFGLVGYPIDTNTWEEDLTGGTLVVTSLGLTDPFRALDANMLRTLSLAHAEEMRFLEEISEIQPELNVVQAYLRLKQWEDFYHRCLPLNEDGTINLGEGSSLSLNRVFTENPTGIKTAVRFNASLLRVIPQRLEMDILRSELSPDLFTQTARNSLPVIIKNSKLPLEVQVVVHEILAGEDPFKKDDKNPYRKGYFNPDNFVIKKSSKGYRVDMHESVLKRAKDFLAEKTGTGQIVIPGCPAGVNIDGKGSPLKKFWDWNVDIGSIVYRDL